MNMMISGQPLPFEIGVVFMAVTMILAHNIRSEYHAKDEYQYTDA